MSVTILPNLSGFMPSPPDDRDYRLERLLYRTPVLPAEYQLPEVVPIRNQGDVGSCVAFSLAASREITELRQGNPVEMSPGFIYANRDGQTHYGEGMIPREALASLLKSGTTTLELFPYNYNYPTVNRLFNELPPAVRREAKPYRITAYVRLYTDEEIKIALMETGPVLACYQIYPCFLDALRDTKGVVPARVEGQTSIGGHAMVYLGWKLINGREYWVLQNSWGTDSGDEGYYYIPMKEYPFSEAWAMTDSILPRNPSTIREVKLSLQLGKEDIAYLDGEPKRMPASALIIGDRIMVPIRFLSEAFGCVVVYEEEKDRQISIYDADREIRLWVDRHDVWVDGKAMVTDVVPTVVGEGYTLVPLRIITEAMGWQVDWSDENREVTVTK